jgi:hypothetical protein
MLIRSGSQKDLLESFAEQDMPTECMQIRTRTLHNNVRQIKEEKNLEGDGVPLLEELLLVEQAGNPEEVFANLSALFILAHDQPAVVRLSGNSKVFIICKWMHQRGL